MTRGQRMLAEIAGSNRTLQAVARAQISTVRVDVAPGGRSAALFVPGASWGSGIDLDLIVEVYTAIGRLFPVISPARAAVRQSRIIHNRKTLAEQALARRLSPKKPTKASK